MTDAVEVALELALLARAQTFATSQSLGISLPNIEFTPPTADKNAKYLRASFLPADTLSLSVGPTGNDQHYGLMQIDVLYGVGGGEIAPGRIASSVISYFKRGTSMTKDGFKVDVFRTPYRGPQLKDGAWTFIPVRIPYQTFAIPA